MTIILHFLVNLKQLIFIFFANLAGLELLNGLVEVSTGVLQVSVLTLLFAFQLLNTVDRLTVGDQGFSGYKAFEFQILNVILTELVDALWYKFGDKVVLSTAHFGRVLAISLDHGVVGTLVHKGNSQECEMSQAWFRITDSSGRFESSQDGLSLLTSLSRVLSFLSYLFRLILVLVAFFNRRHDFFNFEDSV